jgi:hypothetical protein
MAEFEISQDNNDTTAGQSSTAEISLPGAANSPARWMDAVLLVPA